MLAPDKVKVPVPDLTIEPKPEIIPESTWLLEDETVNVFVLAIEIKPA